MVPPAGSGHSIIVLRDDLSNPQRGILEQFGYIALRATWADAGMDMQLVAEATAGPADDIADPVVQLGEVRRALKV